MLDNNPNIYVMNSHKSVETSKRFFIPKVFHWMSALLNQHLNTHSCSPPRSATCGHLVKQYTGTATTDNKVLVRTQSISHTPQRSVNKPQR